MLKQDLAVTKRIIVHLSNPLEHLENPTHEPGRRLYPGVVQIQALQRLIKVETIMDIRAYVFGKYPVAALLWIGNPLPFYNGGNREDGHLGGGKEIQNKSVNGYGLATWPEPSRCEDALEKAVEGFVESFVVEEVYGRLAGDGETRWAAKDAKLGVDSVGVGGAEGHRKPSGPESAVVAEVDDIP